MITRASLSVMEIFLNVLAKKDNTTLGQVRFCRAQHLHLCFHKLRCMDTVFIPNEADFRKWIKEALKECLAQTAPPKQEKTEDQELLCSRKEIAGMFRISLVTLHDWMKRGLPCHKQRGRVYFLRSEVMAYVKQKGNKLAKEPDYPPYLQDLSDKEKC